MGSIVTGIIVGTVVATIGAVVNYIATARRDEQRRKHELEVLEKRWKREDETRHHEKRQQAYLKFIDGAKILPELATYSHVDDPYRHIYTELYGNLNDLGKALRESYSEIEMFASPEVLEAARRLSDKANTAAWIGIAGRIGDDEEGRTNFKVPDETDIARLRRYADELEQLRKAFIEVARKELGVDQLR